MANENYTKEVVADIRKVIEDLQAKHKANEKYRPYAQDIHYELKKAKKVNVSVKAINEILNAEGIVIEQPKPSKVLK